MYFSIFSTRTWVGAFNAYTVGCNVSFTVQRDHAMHITQCGNVDNLPLQTNILCKNKQGYPQRKAKKSAKKGEERRKRIKKVE